MNYHDVEANMRERVLMPLRNEIMKIQVQPDLAITQPDQLNKQRNKILDFKMVFRKDHMDEQTDVEE